MTGYALLAAAIIAEVIATSCLRASEGLTKPGYVVAVVTGYLVAFTALALALDRGLPLAVAYSIWAGARVAAVTVLSVPLFGERFSAVQGLGIALVRRCRRSGDGWSAVTDELGAELRACPSNLRGKP